MNVGVDSDNPSLAVLCVVVEQEIDDGGWKASLIKSSLLKV